jgi:hypothetical protein
VSREEIAEKKMNGEMEDVRQPFWIGVSTMLCDI